MKRALLAPLILILLCGLCEASKWTELEGITYWTSNNYTRVVINLTNSVKFTQNRLSNPERIYFDFKGCLFSKKIKLPLSVSDGILKNVRVGQFDKETVRVVLDLKQEVKSINVFMLSEPYRVVIDLFSKNNIKENKEENLQEKKDKGSLSEIKRVVIDAGHGGEDPGAIGPSGLFEKDVTLMISKKLGEILKEQYSFEVIFTRDTDIFIPLEKRTAIANSKKADLFISIHANASPRREARGIETYFLNWTNDEESMRVAARENAISLNKMKEVGQSDLQLILQDMARGYKVDESLKLAGNVQASLINALSKDFEQINNLGVKWALFYVLIGAKMPSILVETSFISNPVEEQRLSDDRYREKIAEAIAKGIMDYIAPSKIAERTTGKI